RSAYSHCADPRGAYSRGAYSHGPHTKCPDTNGRVAHRTSSHPAAQLLGVTIVRLARSYVELIALPESPGISRYVVTGSVGPSAVRGQAPEATSVAYRSGLYR